ncbi:MAG: hypothetical protein GF350_06100 [Chitinivibrionales bacterium]|nr:hypothetical protein [Chitinivibrionales bacterium]
MIQNSIIRVLLSAGILCLSACSSNNPEESFDRGLVAFYPFNGNANDLSGYSHDGELIGVTPTRNRFEEDSGAFHFDGTGDRIRIPHSEELDIEGSLSISVWIKPEWLSARECIVFRGDDVSGEDPYYIRIYSGNTLDYLVTSLRDSTVSEVGMYDFSMTQIADGNWSHVAMVFENRSSLSLYINGTIANSQQTNFDNRGADRDMDLFIGGAASGQNFYGDIDDVRIYSRALSGNEVAALYQRSN